MWAVTSLVLTSSYFARAHAEFGCRTPDPTGSQLSFHWNWPDTPVFRFHAQQGHRLFTGQESPGKQAWSVNPGSRCLCSVEIPSQANPHHSQLFPVGLAGTCKFCSHPHPRSSKMKRPSNPSIHCLFHQQRCPPSSTSISSLFSFLVISVEVV